MMIRASVSVLALALAAGSSLALLASQSQPGDKSAPISLSEPNTTPKAAADAKQALEFARNALEAAKWISYEARIEGTGVTGDLTANVTMEKADAGGWKIALRGEMKAKGAAKGKAIVLGYDSTVAKAVREIEKQVAQLTNPTADELMLFFAKEKAAGFVAWEVLAEKPLEFSTAELKLEPAVEVAGEMCNVVRATVKGAKAPGEGADVPGGVFYFSQKDGMLRKVERPRPNAKPTDKPLRTVTFSKVEVSKEAKGGEFAIRPPDGFTVKAETGKKLTGGDSGASPSAGDSPAKDPNRTRIKNPTKTASLNPGAKITPFSGDLLGGGFVNFPDDYKGKIVMIDFWATWCGPCVGELPNVVETHKKFKDQGFEILGVTLDNKGAEDKIKSMEDKLGMTWPHVYDGGGWKAEIAKLFGINSIPRAILVDGDTGEILDAGESDKLRGPELAKTIEKALKKKKK